MGSLAENSERSRICAAVPGEEVGRRRGESGGKWRGARVLPLGGRGSSGEGRWRRVRGEGRPAEVLVRCGGALETMGQGGRAWELPGNELKLTGGSICVERRPSR